MDMFVPSPSRNHFATSPQFLSIYDPDRSDIQSFCGGNNFSQQASEATSMEEYTGLDDKFEDITLKHMLTPELMNTFSATTSSTSLDSKSFCDNPESNNNNLTLNEINMDGDAVFLDIFNYDTDDSKLSFPPLDLFTNELKSSNSSLCHTPVPTMCVEPTSVATIEESFHDQDSKDLNSDELMTLNANDDSKTVMNDVGKDFYRKMAPPMKANFPPRETQPPLIGVVTPVKKTEELETPTKDLKSDTYDLKSHLTNLNNVLGDTKNSKGFNTSSTVGYSFHDGPPQTVPSCTSLKRSYDRIKVEPGSPPNKKQCLDSTNDVTWEDVNSLILSNDEDSVHQTQRKRYDSGGSGHMSDSADDDFNKDFYESDDDDDYSDIDADIASLSTTGFESLIDTGKKQKQFFWQYNVQAKGPKGTRLKLAVDTPKDPHILNDFEDPVFHECNTVVAGIRHGGKARKGDGNEITPNPKKLVLIGHQLLRLNKKINACQLGSDVPVSKRNESRKEKNKLASRACRLKKKAQHEANKIKLHGLEEEHSELNHVVQQIWPKLRDRAKMLLKNGHADSSVSMTSSLNSLISNTLKNRVAKSTTEYVNSVILKVEAGDLKGGLNIHSKKT